MTSQYISVASKLIQACLFNLAASVWQKRAGLSCVHTNNISADTKSKTLSMELAELFGV